jgi:hypothetical protein
MHRFFRETKEGVHCDSNWYEGNFGKLGRMNSRPEFSAMAPALLGFDETIDRFCDAEHTYFDNGIYDRKNHAGNCVNSNNNILSLYGDRVRYNICRNLEWQVCAAKGMLPGQGGFGMRFSQRPADLEIHSEHKPFGKCRGWRPPNVAGSCDDGYATDDIFFLEVCLYTHICKNHEELFMLKVGDFFVCKFDEKAFDELEVLLSEEPKPMTGPRLG